MVDRLTDLLHREADGLDVPPPRDHEVLTEGRRLRRRRSAGVAAAGIAAALVVAGGVGLGLTALGGDGETSTASDPGDPAGTAVFGVGSDVHVGDVVAQVPGTVHSMHYTSAGTLVRSNTNGGASDGSGPESLTLVADDGSTTDLGTVPEGPGPATDPDEPVYVLAEPDGDGFEAVVRDAATNDVESTVPLPDLPPSYWDVPPLALDGDTLYVGYRKQTAAVDLTTGDSSIVDGLPGGYPEVNGGQAIVQDGQASISVVDVSSGDTLVSVDITPGDFAFGVLSPDGRFLRVTPEGDGFGEPGPIEVYDVETGRSQEFPSSYGWGWTADGGLFEVEGDTLTTCDSVTGECTETVMSPALPKNADLRLGGVSYES